MKNASLTIVIILALLATTIGAANFALSATKTTISPIATLEITPTPQIDVPKMPPIVDEIVMPAPQANYDYNKDGKIDLVRKEADGNYYVFLNKGTDEKKVFREGAKINNLEGKGLIENYGIKSVAAIKTPASPQSWVYIPHPRYDLYIESGYYANNTPAVDNFFNEFDERFALLESTTGWSSEKYYGKKLKMNVTGSIYGGCAGGSAYAGNANIILSNPLYLSGCEQDYLVNGSWYFGNPGELGDFWIYMGVTIHEAVHSINPPTMLSRSWITEGFAEYHRYNILSNYNGNGFFDINQETADYNILSNMGAFSWNRYLSNDYRDGYNFELQASNVHTGYTITASMLTLMRDNHSLNWTKYYKIQGDNLETINRTYNRCYNLNSSEVARCIIDLDMHNIDLLARASGLTFNQIKTILRYDPGTKISEDDRFAGSYIDAFCEGALRAGHECSKANDQDWETSAVPDAYGGNANVTEFYDIAVNPLSANWTVKYLDNNPAIIVRGYYWNYSRNDWQMLFNSADEGYIVRIVPLPIDSFTNSPLKTKIYMVNAPAQSAEYFEGKITWHQNVSVGPGWGLRNWTDVNGTIPWYAELTSKITFSKIPYKGETVNVIVAINNSGDVALQNVSSKLYQGANLIDSRAISANANGIASYQVPFSTGIDQATTYAFTVKVDDPDIKIEQNEANNNGAAILVVNYSDLVPTNITFSDSNLYFGENVSITANVSNVGGSNLTNVSVRFYKNYTLIHEQFANILAFKSALITTPNFAFAAGAYTIEVRVDEVNNQNESNETNNKLSKSLLVKDAKCGDLDNSGAIDVVDVVKMIDVAFRGGLQGSNPTWVWNVNGDANGAIDVIDVVKIINVAFRGANEATELTCNTPSGLTLTANDALEIKGILEGFGVKVDLSPYIQNTDYSLN
ncbi:MAG: CARDB domain-containing protein [Candidatus Micrarchaeota archaeon]